MTEKAKVVNYDEDAVSLLEEVYGNAGTAEERVGAVAELADQLGKTKASVRAKLSNMGIYVKPGRVSKNGNPIIKKDELVEKVAQNLDRPSEDLIGLEKANKSTLEILVAATAVKDAS